MGGGEKRGSFMNRGPPKDVEEEGGTDMTIEA